MYIHIWTSMCTVFTEFVEMYMYVLLGSCKENVQVQTPIVISVF